MKKSKVERMADAFEPPTVAQTDAIVSHLGEGYGLFLSAKLAGIDGGTAIIWLLLGEDDPADSPCRIFRERALEADNAASVKVLRNIVATADAGDRWAQRWLAKWGKQNGNPKLIERARESLVADPIPHATTIGKRVKITKRTDRNGKTITTTEKLLCPRKRKPASTRPARKRSSTKRKEKK